LTSQPPPACLGAIGPLQLRGFRAQLNHADRCYLEDLKLGPPRLLNEFRIVEDNTPNRAFNAVAVLYQNVFILCRGRLLDEIRTADGAPYAVKLRDSGDEEVLFIYAYFYPRHISVLTKKENSSRHLCPSLTDSRSVSCSVYGIVAGTRHLYGRSPPRIPAIQYYYARDSEYVGASTRDVQEQWTRLGDRNNP
jgi:hypothetical protein